MDFSPIVEKVSRSIAKIYCLDANAKLTGTGSGFVYSKKGLVVTCDHLVEGSQALVCRFPGDADDVFHTTKPVLRDPEHDLAVLKVEVDREPLAQLSAESESKIKPGMPVLFSGYPLSLDALTTHQGILSAVTTDAVGVTTYLIDGTVNSGNSGCPLMNIHGEILGVVNAKRRERSDLLNKVEGLSLGAISLHGIDLVEIYQALISNVQLGIGYAVPASYIPGHKEAAKAPPKVPSVSKPTRTKPTRKK
jgi:S1-C subfamily serine protease